MDEADGRGPRAEQTAHRRRRRADRMEADEKLPIPPEIKARLAAENRVPRWVNDEGGRMHRMTVRDDYDKVDGVEPVPVGTDKAGNPIMAHLLSKPAEFIAEDRENAEARRKEIEASLFRKPSAVDQAGNGANPEPATAERYVAPESKIRRGSNQILEG